MRGFSKPSIINKSISLVGEDKETTIIDGGGNGYIIKIKADCVNISGFTIQKSGDEYPRTGIIINSNFNTITDNTISNNFDGIYIEDSYGNIIQKNNFLYNTRHASFIKINYLKLKSPEKRGRNIWKQNYWNRPRILPKIILGFMAIIQRGLGGGIIIIPWINIDWRPALKPYDNISEAENASVVAKVENSKIKITLTTGGNNYPSTGYSYANSVTIRLNGTALAENNLEGNTGWEVGESLYIGDSTPILDDEESSVGPLGLGTYSITVVIIETVVFDDSITIE